MQARGIDSALVTNQRGELLGPVSSDEMNRKVGGFGARPRDRTGRSTSGKKQCLLLRRSDGCGAKQIMCDAKVAEVPVVTREKLLMGTANLEAIAQDKRRRRP